MLLRKLAPMLAAAALLSGMPALAASPAPQQSAAQAKDATPAFYNLVFRVIDRDGKRIVSSRSYKTSVSTDRGMGGAQIRARDYFAVPGKDAREVGFDVSVFGNRLVGDNLALTMNGSLSSLPTDEGSAASPVLVRSNSWGAVVLLQVNKPTIVYSSDDPSSTHEFEVELTATPMGVTQ